ncbi:MAG: RelA/SpoT family protein, partial [Bacteroidota bacterium]
MASTAEDGRLQKRLEELLVACRSNLRSVDEDLIRKAFEFSLDAHKHDMRASGEPYFQHPYEVAKIVANEIPLDDISVASALLHDVAEDTEYEVKDVRAEFGPTVGDIVDGVTKITDIFRSHEVTQAENYRKLLLSMVNDIRVMLVKFADRLHNMRTLEYLSTEKQKRLAKETLEIYAPFAHRFGLAKIKWELEDLAFKFLYSAEYERMARSIRAKRREREHFIKKFVAPIEKRLKEESFKFEISGRPKHLFSIYNKMIKRAKPMEEIYDLFAVRIILDTENNNDCFGAYGIVTEIYIPIPERFKNYISIPKKNGYQSIHTTVVGPEGKMIEVQIRTRSMHEVAEKGVAAHWKYKENIEALEEELEHWVSWVREIFDRPDEEAPAQQLMESFKLNLYQDEIYVFTPKGDLKILPKRATPLDFAFEIHSNIGLHCIGAKVNGRLVPLNAILKSGDQIEVITSKTQTPSADWEQFVITHKAKANIRKWLKEEKRKLLAKGKDIWEKKLKKHKLHMNEDELAKFVRSMKIDNVQTYYLRIAREEVEVNTIVGQLKERGGVPAPIERPKKEPSILTSFIRSARDSLGGIRVSGSRDDF